ncbi:MAG: hypothetical protein MR419_07625, partial [Clostridiales bacterium]|nr:hypothetical protein [Clostridiales bacterium]
NVHVWRRTVSGAVDFLTSINPNAYQEGTVGDTTIEYLGSLGDKARIEVGSYVGTGTYGSANKNSLAFEFEPKVVIFHSPSALMMPPIYIKGDTVMGAFRAENTNYTTTVTVSAYGNTISWYSNNGAYYQGNWSGTIYHYIAIG